MGRTTVSISDDTLDLLHSVQANMSPAPTVSGYVKWLIEKDAAERGLIE